MLKRHKKSFENLFRLIDIIIILSAFCLAYYLRFQVTHLSLVKIGLQFKAFFVFFLLFWFFFSHRFKLYLSKRYSSLGQELFDVIKTVSTAMALALIPAFYFRQHPLSRMFIIYVWLIQTSGLLLFRIILRQTLRYVRLRGYNYRQVLIIGRNPRAEELACRIKDSPQLGVRFVGCVDSMDNNDDNCTCCSFDFIGNLDDLENILRTSVVDEVFITLPIKTFYSQIEEIISLCERVGVEIKIPTNFFNSKIAKVDVSNYHDIEVLNLYTSPRVDWQVIAKRVIDITVSTIALLVLAPFFAAIALAIKATSKGPVFFIQQRMGYNGRLFNCLKFRTMVENADQMKGDLAGQNEMMGPVFKMSNDPRVTKVGRFLRKTSIDELPQFINVLKGDMSLVGPRPPVPEEVNQYQLTDRRRLSIRPGITCTWQVSGRNMISFDEWMKLDQQYIDEWSLWLDMKILLKTIPAVLLQKGAQ